MFPIQVEQKGSYPVGLEFANSLHLMNETTQSVKCDVVPGRLNQISILVQREEVYYGQCSEICGTNHAFTPIVVEAVPRKDYGSQVSNQLISGFKAKVQRILTRRNWLGGSTEGYRSSQLTAGRGRHAQVRLDTARMMARVHADSSTASHRRTHDSDFRQPTCTYAAQIGSDDRLTETEMADDRLTLACVARLSFDDN
ncbi:cytochrome c oxidase subunit 2-like [Cucumis melo var. makuwa]|uniref:Cytochrome c oxidase polypeptide II n=1 Tax=Cucumis melo var. makuwa TaxID=1194695 RepID=A0A5D3CB84_CUCMM|nr:cytochrome c oxidase subunit 2-like [Cucumis melo var. makuwa]